METKTSKEILPLEDRLSKKETDRFAHNFDESYVNDYILRQSEALESCEKKVKELEEEVKEWEQSFDLYHNACKRGTLEFRKIHPEYPELSLPDTGRMIENLCDRILALEEDNKRLINLLSKTQDACAHYITLPKE